MSRQEILISDLQAPVKEGPVQAEGAPGVWRAVPYRSGDIEGVFLGCGELTAPAETITSRPARASRATPPTV